MNWKEFSSELPPYNKLINVRYSSGGVKLTTFKGVISDEKGIKYVFHTGDFVYQETPTRCSEGEPTHFLVLQEIEGFPFNLQP